MSALKLQSFLLSVLSAWALWAAPAFAEARRVSTFLGHDDLLPVHLNGHADEFTLISSQWRLLRNAFLMGKVGAVLGLGFGGDPAAAGLGSSFLSGFFLTFFGIVNFTERHEVFLVLMPPDQLAKAIKEDTPIYKIKIDGQQFKKISRLLSKATRGGSIAIPGETGRQVLQRVNLDGEFGLDGEERMFQVTDAQAHVRDKQQVSAPKNVSLKKADCWKIWHSLFGQS